MYVKCRNEIEMDFGIERYFWKRYFSRFDKLELHFRFSLILSYQEIRASTFSKMMIKIASLCPEGRVCLSFEMN